MIIVKNGYIQVKEKTGGGLDKETGHPIKPSISFGDPIPCQWRVIKSSNKSVSNGEAFTISQYEILLDVQQVGEQFKLFGNKDLLIGEFSALSIEHLDLVHITKILV